jgi:chloramphenicol O-acetyltransferase
VVSTVSLPVTGNELYRKSYSKVTRQLLYIFTLIPWSAFTRIAAQVLETLRFMKEDHVIAPEHE